MIEETLKNPTLAKEKGYIYPEKLYFTELALYGKLNVSIFCNPKRQYIQLPFNHKTDKPYTSTGIIVERSGNGISGVQRQTIDYFLEKQHQIKRKVVIKLIPFYNSCLNTIINSQSDESTRDELTAEFEEFGAIPLVEGDSAGLEERIYFEDLHIPASELFGNFLMEFQWNLDPEHTICAKFIEYDLVEVNFTSDVDWQDFNNI